MPVPARPYNYVTFGAAKQQLANRLYDSTKTFWPDAELGAYITESLRTWQALTSYWRDDFTLPLQQNVTFYDITSTTDAPNTLRPLTVTDADLYSVMRAHLLEPPSGITSLQFTQDDFVSAVQRRRDEVLSATGCTVTRRLVPAVAGRIALPDTVIDVRRVAYLPTQIGGTPYGIGLYGTNTPAGGLVDVTYTMVATQVGPNMNYVITSDFPGYPLTSSFTLPVNPTIVNGFIGQYSLGFGFAVYVNASGVSNFLLNGAPVAPLALAFYNLVGSGGVAGGLGAFSNSSDDYYALNAPASPQLYSGPESAPTMLVGTFTMHARIPIVIPGDSPAGDFGSNVYGGQLRASVNASVLWPADTWDQQSFNRLYTLLPAGVPLRVPSVYMLSTEPPLEFDVDVPPSYAGSYELLTIESGPLLVDGSPQLLSVPDDWTHVIKWGALADLLSRESNSKDPSRAMYCNQRYLMGLALLTNASALLALRVANIPLQIDAITAGDQYSRTWEMDTPGAPRVAYHAGLNLLAVSPVSDVGPYVVTATVVENAPIPAADGDPLQCGRDDLDVVLDYAQHLAAFKMGGLEFTATLPLFQRFLKAASIYGLKLAELGEYTSVLYDQSQRDAQMHPRMAPAPAEAQ